MVDFKPLKHGDKYDSARKLWEQGNKPFEIAKILVVPDSTIRKWVARFESEKSSESMPIDARDMEIAALKEQIRQLTTAKTAEPARVNVTPAYKDEYDPAAEWARAEEVNAEKIRKALTLAYFTAKLPAEPCAVSFISDQHISVGNSVDLKRMREDAQLIAATPGVYAVLGGDGVDNHVKHAAAIIHARSTPDDQYKLYEWWLEIIVEKLLAIISGNHDDWTTDVAGVSIVQRLAAALKVCFAPDEARIETHVGDTVYKVAVRHQFRMNSSFNLGHAVKQWWRMGDGDFDIGCICHHHEPHVESFNAHGQEKWAARPGSYQIRSVYTRRYGWNPTQPTCPTFILFPDTKRMIGFRDLRDAIVPLEAYRRQYGAT